MLRLKDPSRWLLGLCGGLVVAMAWLFGSSGWGVAVQTRGMSPGALLFYSVWLACLLLCFVMPLRRCVGIMGYTSGLGWIMAAVGSLVHASAAMRWHPVIAGVNLSFLLLGVSTILLVQRYAKADRGEAKA